MGLHIASNLMFSDVTLHTAREEDGTWTVSWLPGHALTRNQAISAMTIAVTVAGSVEPGDLRWLHVEGWAAELGLKAADAVRMAAQPPPDTAR